LSNLTNLHLYGYQLGGNIPESIGNLCNLRMLFLYDNQLSGNIPESIGNLSNLTNLHLYGNQLSGNIPESIGNLSNLTNLHLYGNQLSGNIPESIGNLCNLRMLFLYDNQLSGNIPESIGNLSNLKFLILYSNQLSGNIPESIGNLSNLKFLILYSNQLSGNIPESIGNLSNLITLYLYSNQLSGNIPELIGNLSNLKDLYLDSNQLSGKIPGSFEKLTQLKDFDLSYNCLHTNNSELKSFLTEHSPEWEKTQTIAPNNITSSSISYTQIQLSWDTIPFNSGDGCYEIWISTSENDGYTIIGKTKSKSIDTFLISNININTKYYFKIRTNSEVSGLSSYTSEFSAPIFFTITRNYLDIVIHSEVFENDGLVKNIGTIYLPEIVLSDLTIDMISGDSSKVTVIDSITIPQGYSSTDFSLSIIDNEQINGSQYIMITATALNYTSASANILIRDNEHASLTVKVPDSLNEADINIIGQSLVICSHSVDNDIIVNLTTDDLSRLFISEDVIIPKGYTSATFDLSIIDNKVIDGNKRISITASSSDFYSGIVWIDIIDNENRQLKISNQCKIQYTEDKYKYTNCLNIQLSGTYESDLLINLTSSNQSEITLFNTITIPSGNTSFETDLFIIDDEYIDGNQSVTITASSPAWYSDSVVIKVYDNENNQIILTIPENVNENQGIIENFGNISISGILLNDFNVKLTVSDPTELTLPETIVIPAGCKSTSFTASILDDIFYDGSQSVTITASSIILLSVNKELVVHDSETSSLNLILPSELKEGEKKEAFVYMDSLAEKDVLIELSTSNNEINIPETVTIKKGYTIVDFYINANDDNFIDGSQLSEITAYVKNWHLEKKDILILDNEKKEFSITFKEEPVFFVEGIGMSKNKGKIIITGITLEDIVVYLSSSDPTEITVLNSVILSKNSDYTEFDVYLPDDDIVDSAQTISLTVSAPGWISATKQLIVLDSEMIFITTEDNENNDGTGKADNDIGKVINRHNDPIEFNIDVKNYQASTSAYLSLFIKDIDYPYEVDEVYFNGNYLGYAIGVNDLNYSTLFIIPNLSWIRKGTNLVQIEVDVNHGNNIPGKNSNWEAIVQSGQLIFDNENNVGTVAIKTAHSDSTNYTFGDDITITLELSTTLDSQNIRLEQLLKNPLGKILKFFVKYEGNSKQENNYLIKKDEDKQYQWKFKIPNIEPNITDQEFKKEDLIDGIWAVNISVYDLTTQLFQCTKTITFSVPYDAEILPSIKTISPNSGNIFEAKAILITGTNFIDNEINCKLGNYDITNQTIVNNTQITGNISNFLSPGIYDLVCQATYGTASLPEAYTVFAPLISLPQNNVLFDKTYVNHSEETVIFVSNSGNKDLSISQINLSDATNFHIQNNLCANQVLNPSESCTITLSYTPLTYGEHQAELSICSNDPYTSSPKINIQGIGALFDLELQDCYFSYTTIAGESMSISWIVKNIGENTTKGRLFHTIYVSSDDQIGNDTQLNILETTQDLAAETSFIFYSNIYLPDHSIGKQWLVFQVNASNPVIEISEKNNIRICGPLTIIDKTPPVTSFHTDGNVYFDGVNYYAREDVQYSLKAEDKYGIVQKIEYQINNSLPEIYTKTFQLTKIGINNISFRSQDDSDNWEDLKNVVVNVEVPPAKPYGLEGNYIYPDQIQLKWSQNQEPDFSYYILYQNQEKIAEILINEYVLENVITDNIYNYQISAVNKIGLESNLSDSIIVSTYQGSFVILRPHDEAYVIDKKISISGFKKASICVGIYVNGQFQQSSDSDMEGLFEITNIILAEGENVITGVVVNNDGTNSEQSDPITIHYIKRPYAPENLKAVPNDTTITLNWDDPNEADIIGYYIYRNNERLLYQFPPINQKSFTDTRLSNGITYTYAVTCIDSKYIESMTSIPVSIKPVAGDWKIHASRKKRSLENIEIIDFTAPSQNNKITINVLNTRSPLSNKIFTVTAAIDDIINVTNGISKKKLIKAGQEHSFVFTFDINCLSEDRNHLLNFNIIDNSGYEYLITKSLFIRSKLNKCQSCNNGNIVSVICHEKECLTLMGCKPSSGCQYIPEENAMCNIDISDNAAVYFIDENSCQSYSELFFSPFSSLGNKDTLPIEISLNETRNVSAAIYKTNGDWIKSLIHNQSMESGKYYVSWDGKNFNEQNVESGLYQLIVTKDDQITAYNINIDSDLPEAQITNIIQPTEGYIEIYGTGSDPNIYSASIDCLSCNENLFDIYMKPLPIKDDLIAVMNFNEIEAREYTICFKVIDLAGNEKVVFRNFWINQSTGAYSNDNTIVSDYNVLPDFPDVWVDDFIPAGSKPIDTWEWVTNIRYSGTKSHTNLLKDGVQGHYFICPDSPLYLSENDNIVQYIYLSPENPPLEILLQFYTENGNGEHRGYWGENLIQTGGIEGTASLKYMGKLPETGKWIRLIIPSAYLDLSEKQVRGIAYVSYHGKVWWDRTTKSSKTYDPYIEYKQVIPIPSGYQKQSTINYKVLQKEKINVSVYKQEELIKTLVDAVKEPGDYHIIWDWTDNHKNIVSNGTYIVRMSGLSNDIGNISVQNITSHIRFPYKNTLLTGEIPVIGTAAAIDFDHFIVEFANANDTDQWFLLNYSYQQAFDMNECFTKNNKLFGNLAIWQIEESLMMGQYIIRLQVFNKQGNMEESSVKVYIARPVDIDGTILKSNDNMVTLSIPENAILNKALISIIPEKWSDNFPIPTNLIAVDKPYMIKTGNFLLSDGVTIDMSYKQLGTIDLKTLKIYQWYSDSHTWTETNSTINTSQKKLSLNLLPDSCISKSYAVLSGQIESPLVYEPIYSADENHVNLHGCSFPGSMIEIIKNDNILASISANHINGLFLIQGISFDHENTIIRVRTYDIENNYSNFTDRIPKLISLKSNKKIITTMNRSDVNNDITLEQIIRFLQILSGYYNND